MNQAKVPVDGDGVEPQVCVIEVSWLGFYTLCGLNWVLKKKKVLCESKYKATRCGETGLNVLLWCVA